MTLSKKENLTIIQDILSKQLQQCQGKTAEYEQIIRLIDNLKKEKLDKLTLQTLDEIATYCATCCNKATNSSQLGNDNDRINSWIAVLTEQIK